MTNKCRVCGKSFEADKAWKSICSKECMREELGKSQSAMDVLKRFTKGK